MPAATRAATAASWRTHTRRALLPGLLLTVVAVLAPTLRAPLFMDDFVHLLLIEGPKPGLARLHGNTYGVTALPRDEVRWALPWWTSDEFEFNYFRPASTALLALDVRLWGRESWGYHLTSLLAHVLAVALVWRLLGAFGVGARGALAHFLHDALENGYRCVRLIHGKGLGSPGREPVLKKLVLGWLAQRCEVQAFCQARPAEGGAGAEEQ